MIRKTIKGGDFKSQMVGELVFDQVPEEGSFNPVTSDAVVKAIDEAKEDMQDKIDEVTLDPSAVALGNVHLLDEVTEFPADGCILIDSETDGPGEMSKDTLLELTAQNALAGRVATEFVENSTNAKACFPYVWKGKLYVAKEDYSGTWDVSKFISFNLGSEVVKTLGLDTDFGLLDANNAPNGSFIYCGNISNIPTTSVNLLTICRKSDKVGYKTQVAFKVNSNLVYVRGCNSDGDVWTPWKKIMTADDYNDLLNTIIQLFRFTPLNLNDSSLWEVGGISSSTGNNESNSARLRTKTYYEVVSITQYSIAYQNGMTCPSGFALYCYDKDGAFLGRIPTNNSQPSAAWISYPSTKFIRFGFTNLVGSQTILPSNLSNIAVFSGNLSVYQDYVDKEFFVDGVKKIGCYDFTSSIVKDTSYIPSVPRIHDNFILQVEIIGEIDDVYVGMGYLKNQGLWLEITPTKVYMKGGYGDSQLAEYTHNLTLGTTTIVRIWRNDYENNLNFSIHTEKMDYFKNTYEVTGQFAGQVFVRNVADSDKNLSVVGSYSIKRVSADVWIWGDSYCGCHTNVCWPYHLIQMGVKSFFIQEENGISAYDAYDDLEKVFTLNSTPKLLVWAIGMNNSSDSGGVPPSMWVTKTDAVVKWCRDNNIKLALVTIPTIPTKDNSAKNSYIRSLVGNDIVVVDAAAAVEEEGTTTWKFYGTNRAFLSSDGIHPSAFGAMAIAAEVLRKLPEIAIE